MGKKRKQGKKKAPAKAGTPKPELTPKQVMWVAEYLVDMNAYQAALRVGYTEAYARVHSHKWVPPEGLEDVRQMTPIQAAVWRALAKRRARVEVSANRVLLELARVAFHDIRSVVKWGRTSAECGVRNAEFEEDGMPGNYVRLVDSGELTEDDAAAVESISEGQFGVRVKMHNKVEALEKLGKHLGIWRERHEVTGANGGPILVEENVSDEEFAERIAAILERGRTRRAEGAGGGAGGQDAGGGAG
jgi:phage terminase small subunit